MSIKLNLDDKDKDKNNSSDDNKNNNSNLAKEHKWKELLYELFYEIKSEILGCKIEIEEEEYQENIRTIKFPKLIKYIHDSIQILLRKKIEEAKYEQKENDEKNFQEISSEKLIFTPLPQDEKKLYENIILNLEARERKLSKIIFQQKLQKDAMECKIAEYVEMEEEFEEMKAKLKYEEGRFLKNDRKDNEIIIIRSENSNLKQGIKKLEQQVKTMEKSKQKNIEIIHKMQDDIKILKNKIDELKKQNEILNAHSINININNLNGEENKNGIIHNNNINGRFTKEEIIMPKHNNIQSKMFPFQKIKNKFINPKNPNSEILSNTRNESLERTKSELLSKYFNGNKINKNSIYLNNSSLKNNQFQYGNNQILNISHRNNSHLALFNKHVNIKNFNAIKKVIYSGGNNSNINNIRSNSTKIKGNVNKIIDYKAL